ncbi:MAG: pilus assembly protein PilM [bacterium]
MHSSVMGIEIGLAEIKVIQVSKKINSIEVVKSCRYRLSSEEDMPSAIKRILSENRIRGDMIVAGISSQQAVFRDITLPFRDFAKIAKIVKYEVESSLPYPAEEAVLALQVRDGKDEGASDLFIAAVRKEAIISCCQSLNDAGIDPQYVLLDCTALYNLYLHACPSSQDIVALIDINEERILVVIVQGEHLLFSRNISHPIRSRTDNDSRKEAGERIAAPEPALEPQQSESPASDGREEGVERVEEGEGYPGQEAALEARPDSPAIDESQPEVVDLSREMMDQILDQVDLTLYAFSSQYRLDGSISRILLTGSAAGCEGISDYFTERLQIETSIFDPCEALGEENAPFRDQSLCWSVPLGLVFGARKDRKSRFNLRQEDLVFQKKYSQYKEMALVLAVLLVVAASLLTVNIHYRTTVQQKKLNQINRDIYQVYREILPAAKGAGNELEQVKKALNKEREKYEIYKTFAGKSLTHLEIFRDLSIRISDEIKVEFLDLSIDKNQIKIKGIADSFEAVDRLKSSLQKTRQYAQAVVESAKVKGSDNKVDFRLSITVSDS